MIRIFGDSFSQDWNDETTWHNFVGEEYCSYAVQGTSIWFSIDKLFHWIHSDEYSEDDKIVFVITAPYRAIRYTDDRFPHFHVSICQPDAGSDDGWHKYATKNHNAHEYMLSNILTLDLFMNQEEMLRALLHGLPNKSLVIPAFDILYDEAGKFDYWMRRIKKLRGYTFTSDNMDDYIHPMTKAVDSIYQKTFTLLRVSNNEFSDRTEFRGFIDKRKNHLSPPNHAILGELIQEYFDKMDYSIFKLEKFKRGII